MALFQLLLKEDSESTEVYCVLIVTDYGTCATLFFKVLVLDCVFTLNYGGAVPPVNWDVTSAVRSVYAREMKRKKKTEEAAATCGIIRISLILLHLYTVRLLLYALSCQCVQADLLSRCMHNLAAMKPA